MKLGTLLVCSFLLASSTSAAAQTSAQRNQQSVLLLEKSLTLLSRGGPIQNVSLSASVHRIAGSLKESGTATLKGTATGESRIDLTLPSGDRQQVRDVAAGSWTGSWSDKDGTWHSIAPHNLWTDPTWYFPAFLIGHVLSDAGYKISPAKSQTVAGTSAECIAVSQEYNGSLKLSSLVQKLSSANICLSSQTLLPVAIEFNIHPDKNAMIDIPVRVQFSNYRGFQGDAVAYHIERYVQNNLVLNLDLSSIQINAGLSASTFEVQ